MTSQDLISDIYDCAADPALWPETLSKLNQRLSGAYCLVGFADLAKPTGAAPPMDMASRTIQLHSPWDSHYIRLAGELFMEIPGVENYMLTDSDESWNQMSVLPEEQFRASDFYKKFCHPQGLRDCLNLNVIKRPDIVCGMAVTRLDNQPLFNAADQRFVEEISPHLRRALLINDAADKGKLSLTLLQRMLDLLPTAVMLIGQAGKIEFANAKAEELLSAGHLVTSTAGVLAATGKLAAQALDAALARAARGDDALGLAGNGVPLHAENGEIAAAYVLPLGKSDVRHAMGRGYCAVFIAQRGEQLPLLAEMLRSLFDLTPTEARISLKVAQGEKPVDIAQHLDVSINTVRTHLSHVYSKTETADQQQLANLLSQLAPPVRP